MVFSSDASKSRHARDEHPQCDNHSRDESLEYLGTIRKELRRILPHILDLPLLRWSGGKVQDLTLGFEQSSSSSSSDSKPESYSDSGLPPTLNWMVLPPYFSSILHCSLNDNFFKVMSSRITLSKLANKVGERKKIG